MSALSSRQMSVGERPVQTGRMRNPMRTLERPSRTWWVHVLITIFSHRDYVSSARATHAALACSPEEGRRLVQVIMSVCTIYILLFPSSPNKDSARKAFFLAPLSHGCSRRAFEVGLTESAPDSVELRLDSPLVRVLLETRIDELLEGPAVIAGTPIQ